MPADPGAAPFHRDVASLALPMQLLPQPGDLHLLAEYSERTAVSLFGYIAKAAHDGGRIHFEPSIATAVFVPIAGLAIWWTVRSIRKKHIAGENE